MDKKKLLEIAGISLTEAKQPLNSIGVAIQGVLDRLETDQNKSKDESKKIVIDYLKDQIAQLKP